MLDEQSGERKSGSGNKNVGYAYDKALEVLDSLGVRELAVFEGRERRLEPIG